MFALRALQSRGRRQLSRGSTYQHADPDHILLIMGNGGLAREMFWHMRSGGYRGRILMYSDYGGQTTNASACIVINNLEHLPRFGTSARYMVGVGSPVLKQQMAAHADKHGIPIAPTYVHPLAHVADTIRGLGRGGFIAPGVLITTNVTLGDHVTLNLGVTVGHDAIIGSYCTVNPNAAVSGNVRIGQQTLVGALAGIREGIVVGERATIGLGAAVVKNVADGETVVGVAAAPLVKSPVVLRSMCVRSEAEPLD